MKVLLICSGGMSTQILISSLEKEAKKIDLNFSAEAIGVSEIEDYQKDFDILLVAPQIKFKFDAMQEIAKNREKKVYQIQPTEYNPVGAAKLIQNIKKIMEAE